MDRNIYILGECYAEETLNEVLCDSQHDNFSIVDFTDYLCVIHFREIEVVMINGDYIGSALNWFKENMDEDAIAHLTSMIEEGEITDEWSEEDEL